MNDNLVDRVIDQLNKEEEINASKRTDQWGIDDTGFPWPNPVNAQAVAVRVFSKWGQVKGIDNIYKIEDDIFLGGKKLCQSKATLLSLYEKPKIIVWANQDPDMQNEDELWKQVKHIISSEWPIIWAIIREISPEYDRDYIRIKDGLIWDKNNTDIIVG